MMIKLNCSFCLPNTLKVRSRIRVFKCVSKSFLLHQMFGILESSLTLQCPWTITLKKCANLHFFFQIRNLSSIRKMLPKSTAEILVHAFITSCLDNGNALLNGISEQQIHKLQIVKNSAARALTNTRKFDHITPVRRELHRLPIRERIQYKTALLTWKARKNMAPSYISELLTPYIPPRTLRSSDKCLLETPKTSSTSLCMRQRASKGILNLPTSSLHLCSPFHQNRLVRIHHQFTSFPK